MRIAVFSTPRTCSTFVCEILASKFNLHNYKEEIYGNFVGPVEGRTQILYESENYVTKLFARYFDEYIDVRTFDWNIFDYVFITQRNNLSDQMASLYNIWNFRATARLSDVNTIDLENKTILERFSRQKRYMQLFYNIKNSLLNTHKNVFVLEYERLQTSTTEYLNRVTELNFSEQNIISKYRKSNIDYKLKYTNYNQLKEIVDSWGITE
jgi:hypothetical protein